MEQKVTAFIRDHDLLKEGSKVLVGVSGGPDSIALLHFLHSKREAWNLTLIAIAVDHQLRGDESKADVRFVETICEKWNISFESTSINVPSYKQAEQLGTQVAARKLRYFFFEKMMEKYDADYLALGHHGDDQIETLLMRFARISDARFLQGIPFKREFAGGYIIRPLLAVTKKEIEQYCALHNVAYRIDPSNEHMDYTRNFFRKNMLPLLKEKNSNIHTTVQRLSETLAEDESYLQQEAKKLFERTVKLNKDAKTAHLEISAFQSCPTALQRRAYHLILNYLYQVLPKNLSYVHEEQFFSLLKSTDGHVQIDFPHHLKVERSYHTVMFYFEQQHPQATPFFHHLLEVPGKVVLPDNSTLTATLTKHPEKQDAHTYHCLVESVSLPLHIRTRQSGDRMSWDGLRGTKKIKDIFIDAKVPMSKRDRWPIVTDHDGNILWLIGLKKGQAPLSKRENTSFITLFYEKDSNQEGQ
ncbi:tRNA lysidine(34) synthetase TilS [Virgibacillus sp. LDC-1]|uniref:tRNA lysidine(34) synthetase TilS n=1 Tax=Virgibacillus sp. LDC-1 TaxID=3039856 RepID=UPI0024DE7CD1|nr:tRNA lysidine(34) synthetase TilS [Virgibacillus sp. LDC-1]